MAYNYRAHCFVFHGVCLCICTLTQGFYLGYLMNTVPNPTTSELVTQALATHRTGWLASFWLLIFGATLDYCDLPTKWAERMYYILVYQAYHQVFLNNYFTALGMVGGRLPMVITFNLKYDIAVLISLSYSPIVYFGSFLWAIGVYRKFKTKQQ